MDRYKAMVGKVMDKVLNRTLHDIDDELQRRALHRTADFVERHMTQAQSVREGTARASRYRLLDMAIDLAPDEGLVLEFGVASGDSLRHIASRRSPVHGFDSFKGLPENWRPGIGLGHFAQDVPKVDGAQLHVGWFEDTLPPFLAEHSGPAAFAHIDADLYSSTKTILTLAQDRFVPGSVLLFDEYFNGPYWEEHEHRAFVEFIERMGRGFEYVAYSSLGEQVLVQLKD